MSEKYSIKIEKFEGPFDLLFHLIEKNKIDIYDIPIADITEQYINYLEAMSEMDLEIASEFLVMASTLIYIKSKMLLPKNKNIEEDQEIDPREELVARLLEYKKYKMIAEDLKEREKIQHMVFYKYPDVIENEGLKPQLVNLNPDDLFEAFSRILEKSQNETLKENSDFPRIIYKEKVSVAKKVRDIVNILKNNKVIKFFSLFDIKSSKMDKIATFLAVLELIKLKKVIIEQIKDFDDIVIYKA